MLPKQLGNYEVIEKIGAGGMGEVYRARDERLGRDVALKILPSIFADDADRLGRFEREARLLAALNHPGIGAIYGLEEAEGHRFLVLELVPGEDLSQRISRGPIPPDEALPIARDIAEAVEFAHEQGVVHRDLKPANVKITPDGRVKVLDFGLAKAFDSDDPRDPRLSQSPTLLASSPTIAGIILGTAGYMSPEQARGKSVDKRSDVFAFGCVFYEMLTGRQTFAGETISDTLASVLKTMPDLALLPIETPRAIRDLLKRCLEKDPKLRLRDIGEARIAIDQARHAPAEETAAASAAVVPARRGKRDLVWGATLLAVAAVSFFGAKRMTPGVPDAPLRKFVIDLEENSVAIRDNRIAFSDDGRRIAYVNNDQLWVRDLSKPDAHALAGTEGADGPAWSPDGVKIAYRVGTTFHRIPAEGGNPIIISATSLTFSGGASADWTEDGRIIFSTGGGPVMQVSAQGGDPAEATPLLEDETDVHEPSALPGGRGILYVAHLKKGGPCELRLVAGGKTRTILKAEAQRLWNPRYSSTGHIIYRRTPNNSGIWALPFSLSKLEVTGEPFLVALDGAEACPGPDGMLVHRMGGDVDAMGLVIFSSEGTVESKIGEIYELVGQPSLSPDGNHLAAVISDKNNGDVWVFDLKRGTRTRLTFDPNWDIQPAWSPDGTLIYYAATSRQGIYEVASDGSGKARFIHAGLNATLSADGKWMTYEQDNADTRSDAFVIPFPCDTSAVGVPIAATKAIEGSARISPDGRFVAYVSNESGRNEIYLTRFPEPAGKWQVSTHGGSRPRWDRKGGKLFYTSDTELMEVEVSTTPSLQLGTPRALFLTGAVGMVMGRTSAFEVIPGGRQIIGTYSGVNAEKPHLSICVVENWLAEFNSPRTAKK
jgi:eukaryotic-like serine/threonine-protein kinase